MIHNVSVEDRDDKFDPREDPETTSAEDVTTPATDGTDAPQRVFGALRGQIEIADDFDELPDELKESFGAE